MARKTSRSSDVAELANKAIAKRLRELVTDTTVLAKHLDCSIQAINQYKQGTSQPKIENIIKIAEFYNVSVDYLFGITETKNRDTTIQAICEETGLSEKAVNGIRGYESLPLYDELSEIQKQKLQASAIIDEARIKKIYNGLRKGYLKKSERLVKTQNKLFEADGYRKFIEELEEYLKSETLHKKAKDKLKTIPYSENMTGSDIMELVSENEEEEKIFIEALDMIDEEEKAKEKAEYKFYKLNQSFEKLIEGIVSKELEKE